MTDGGYRLTMIDLGSGRASALGIDGYAPAWTRDGRWIVYAALDQGADFMNPYRLWVIPADLTDRPRQIPGQSVVALAGGSRIVVYDLNARGQAIMDVADGKQVGRFPDLVDGITWRSASPQYAFIRNQQQTPGGGRPDDVTSIVVAADELGSPRVVVQRTGSQYEVRFRDLRWNPLRDELLYSVEGIGSRTVSTSSAWLEVTRDRVPRDYPSRSTSSARRSSSSPVTAALRVARQSPHSSRSRF